MMCKTKYDCVICSSYISWEHGGIVCSNCNALYCCSEHCVGKYHLKYLTTPNVGSSQIISQCRSCAVSQKSSQVLRQINKKYDKVLDRLAKR